MKVGILSRNSKLYSTRRLAEACRERGHDCRIIDYLKCYMNINSEKPVVHYKEEVLDDIDAIIPRIGASQTFYGTAVVRQFEMGGVYSVNESVAISRSRDKLRALQILSKKKLGLPTTSFGHATKMTDDLLEIAGTAPVIIKVLEGTQGKGVVLSETKKAAESVIDLLRGVKSHFLVQEFVKEAGGADIRCFVIGDKVIAAMKRQGPEGEFRSNLHRGGSAQIIKITKQERETAVKAARAMGLNVAGVDLLRSERGPLIMEVNSSPGLEGIEKTTGLDVAAKIVEFIEKAIENKKSTRTRGKG
jgi:ribosomal protein S6--L-glutamate ligase